MVEGVISRFLSEYTDPRTGDTYKLFDKISSDNNEIGTIFAIEEIRDREFPEDSPEYRLHAKFDSLDFTVRAFVGYSPSLLQAISEKEVETYSYLNQYTEPKTGFIYKLLDKVCRSHCDDDEIGTVVAIEEMTFKGTDVFRHDVGYYLHVKYDSLCTSINYSTDCVSCPRPVKAVC